jgi:UDP-N-acetylglucosamine 2-epimerase (non-hydrolysing)
MEPFMPDSLRVAVVIGTRAQMVKMAPVMRALQDARIPYWFLHTGQHRETFDDLREEYGVKPPDQEVVATTDDAKDLLRFGGWGTAILARLVRRRQALLPFRNGIVLVHGDTASTVWGALLGRLTGNRVFHVESGLRSYNLLSPFPEELLRLITFHLSDVYGCPADWAMANLQGFKGTKIDLGANTLYDAYRTSLHIPVDLPFEPPKAPYSVFSIHRFETLYRRSHLEQVVECIERAAVHQHTLVVKHSALMHRLSKAGLLPRLHRHSAIQLIPRVRYAGFMQLIRSAEFVVTDGGSNQEELYYMGKPTLLLRKATERREGLGQNARMAPVGSPQIEAFFEHYRDYRQPPVLLSASPSAVIVDWIRANYLSKPAHKAVLP